MFTFRGHKGDARHNYAGERYTTDGTQCIVHALPEPVPDGASAPAPRAYIIPLIGSDAYDKIEVFNHFGYLVETLAGSAASGVIPADLVAQMSRATGQKLVAPRKKTGRGK